MIHHTTDVEILAETREEEMIRNLREALNTRLQHYIGTLRDATTPQRVQSDVLQILEGFKARSMIVDAEIAQDPHDPTTLNAKIAFHPWREIRMKITF